MKKRVILYASLFLLLSGAIVRVTANPTQLQKPTLETGNGTKKLMEGSSGTYCCCPGSLECGSSDCTSSVCEKYG
jgi:hypothetical protein